MLDLSLAIGHHLSIFASLPVFAAAMARGYGETGY
jgi:uncharacterized membrane protein